MIALLSAHAILTVVVSLAMTLLHGNSAGLSTAAGGLFMLVNLTILVFTWPRILAKKSVALSIVTIVFKFALLGWILFEVVRGQLILVGWFALGMALVVPTVLYATFLNTSETKALGQ